MGIAAKTGINGDSETSQLLPPTNQVLLPPRNLVYFTLGAGFLLPWSAFIIAVDYFAYLYPDASVDRIFAAVYMLVCWVFIVFCAHVSGAYLRINVGLAAFVVSLLIVPVMDVAYVKGQVGLYSGFYVAVALSGLGMRWCKVGLWLQNLSSYNTLKLQGL